MSKVLSFGLGGLAVALGIVTLGCGASGGAPRALLQESDGGVEAGADSPPLPPVAPDELDFLPAPSPGGDVAPGEPPDAAPSSADAGSAPGCAPEAGSDDPDEAFQDTNCDGIDGDLDRAVFVATTGTDDAVGTPDAPVATLGRGIALAAEQAKDVYVCNGAYAEQVVISKIAVRVYGGYACERAWKRVPDRAVIAPSVGPALRVEQASGEVVLERLAFRVPAATDVGASSIAGVLLDSPGVTLTRVELEAGDAGPGRAGSVVPDPEWTLPRTAADAPTTAGALSCAYSLEAGLRPGSGDGCRVVPSGASGPFRFCPDGTPILGGAGGKGANVAYQAAVEAGHAGAPGGPTATVARAGADGTDGAAPPSGFGRLVSGIYELDDSSRDGVAGGLGFAGHGGDGAPSFAGNGDTVRTFRVGGGGGQGGYPGCGGPAGKRGSSGGASIALVADRTPVTLVWSTLATGRGGDGGVPSRGWPGQPGGEGGKGGGGENVELGGSGRGGGSGGRGGQGGPGAGGPSVGIAYAGVEPVLDDTRFVLGAPGLGASGWKKAPDGVGAETHEFAR